MGGALWRKGALRDRLNDAVKQLQAAERGKDPDLQGPACLSTQDNTLARGDEVIAYSSIMDMQSISYSSIFVLL